MKLEPMYRVRFNYPEGWSVRLGEGGSTESRNFFLSVGTCEGRIEGSFRGANHPARRSDGTFLPDFQGVIETTDGATVLFDWRGYGRAYPPGSRQVVCSGLHWSDHERYRWLNDSQAVGVGEVRGGGDVPMELVVDWYEVGWSPLPESWPPAG
jgi:hypothetical protein